MVIPLVLAPACKASSLAARESGTSTPAAVDREQPADALMHQRDFESGWSRAAANETKLVIIRGRQGLGSWRGTPATARCVPAAMCRRRKVICVKRCYTARSRLARVPPATKCVIRCKKCVPTC
ncbi:unnamed protein product [Alopecurus aequalis]